MDESPLLTGIPDGEVFRQHLTRHLTKQLTNWAICRRRRFPASQQHIGSAYVAGVTLGSVTSYVGTIVGAERRFRPQQHISGNNVAGVTLGSVTSYVAIVGAVRRFRPQQHISGNNVAGVTLGSVTSYITHRWQAL